MADSPLIDLRDLTARHERRLRLLLLVACLLALVAVLVFL